MKVLMITGDKNFGPGQPRYEMQRAAVETLGLVYWGHGNIFPNIPEERFDVVTAQDPFWRGLVGWHMARRIGAPLNIQVHADLSAQSFTKCLLARMVLRHAHSIRVVSQKLKEQVEAIGIHVPVTVLPVFVDIEKFHTVLPVPHQQKTILWMGRFEKEKDPLFAIDVLEVVRAKVDAKLVMLGRGNLEAQLHARAGAVTPPTSVEFPGWRDPVDYLAQADVVLCTSRRESWGASIVEALAAGLPVVAPDVGVAREAGAFVVPREQLAGKIIEVLRTGERGALKLQLLTHDAWARCWRESLSPGRVEA